MKPADITTWGDADLSGVRIGIVIQDLGAALASGKGDHCLDLETGDVVRTAGCPEGETGEGRPALRTGKRFVRIPAFDELSQEFKRRLDNEQVPQDKAWVRSEVENSADRDEFLGWFDFLRQEGAEQEVALRWVASLRPDFKLAMVDESDAELLYLYDPGAGRWVDCCEDDAEGE
jgi:hypothetical protein